MQQMLKNLFTLIFMLIIHSANAQVSISQSVIASGGNFSSTSTYSISSTTGESMVSTKISGSIDLTEGFQQSSSSSTTTSLKQMSANDFSILVYPNPTSDYISIEVTTDTNLNLGIEIVDMLGKTCKEIITLKQFKDKSIYQCNVNEYPSGIYFLKVTSVNGNNNKTIKIQKIN